MSDPIWDDTGAPEPEFEALRRTLSPLAWQDRPFVAPFWTTARRFALVAAVVVAIAAAPILWWFSKPALSLTITTRDGVATSASWRTGSSLKIGESERATIALGTFGRVVAHGGARLELQQADARQHRIRLESGEIDASLAAPPRRFAVVTPHAVAVDLGCAFDLKVTENETWLGVTSGAVSLETPSETTVVPAGYTATARAGRGPGLPFSISTTPEFAAAVERFDLGTGSAAELAARATPVDAVTLLHVLQRAPASERSAVFAKLLELAPPRAQLRDSVLRGDHEAMRAWAKDILRTP